MPRGTIRRKTCRVCGGQLKTLFSLGNLAISTFVEKPNQKVRRAPLEMTQCQFKECGLWQLRHTAPQELMYSGHYWYRSGLNQIIMEDLKEIAKQAIKIAKPKRYNIFLDLGCNDGTLLSYVPKRYTRIGVEPAKNLQLEARKWCDFLIGDFWSFENYENMFKTLNTKTTNPKKALLNHWAPEQHEDYYKLHNWLRRTYGSANHCDECKLSKDKKFEWANKSGEYKKDIKDWMQLCIHCHRKLDGQKRIQTIRKAKIITAAGMFYDAEDPNQFIADVKKALADDGLFVSQLMTLAPMLRQNDVGNICAEHLEYYSYKSLVYLFEKNGLEIFRVEENSINGGSYRIFARHYKNGSISYKEPKANAADFWANINANKVQVKNFIEHQVKNRKKIVFGYGASTKFNTILQWYKLDNSLIAGIADKSREKWGKYTPVTNIRIFKEEGTKKLADYYLIGPYAFKDFFIKNNYEWIKKGGTFISHTPRFDLR